MSIKLYPQLRLLLISGIVSSSIGASESAFAARVMYVPPLDKEVSFQFRDDQFKTIKNIFVGIGALITVTNISQKAQTVNIVLQPDSSGHSMVYNKSLKADGSFVGFQSLPTQGYFLTSSIWTSGNASFAESQQFKADGNCQGTFSSKPSTKLSGIKLAAAPDFTLPSASPQTSDNSKSLFIVFYAGGDLTKCPSSTLDADGKVTSFYILRECPNDLATSTNKCAGGKISFNPQIVITIDEDQGAVVSSMTVKTFVSSGAGLNYPSPLAEAEAKGPQVSFEDYDRPIIQINGGRPF